MTHRFANRGVFACALFGIAAASWAQAAPVTWEGNVSGALTNAANWVGGVAPVSAVDGVVFNAAGTAGTSLTLGTPTQYASAGVGITYGATAPSYTIAGSQITIGTGGVNVNSNAAQFINTVVKRNTNSSTTLGVNAATLVFNNTYDLSGGALPTVAFGNTLGGNVFFNGNLVNTAASGTYGFTTTGGTGYGTVTLGGSSTLINGPLTLAGNTMLKLANANAVSSGTISPNGANVGLWLAADTALPSYALNFSAATSPASHFVVIGTGTSGAAVTNQSLTSLSMGSQQGFNFVKAGNVASGTPQVTISNAATINYTSAGRSNVINADGIDLILAGGATTTGTAGGPSQVLVLGGDSTGSRVTGLITNGSATSLSLTKAGPGTWTLTNANTFTGNTVITGGSLKLDFNAAGAPVSNILQSTGSVSLSGNGILAIDGKAGSASTQQLASVATLGSLGGRVTLRAGAAGGSLAVTTGTLTVNTGSILEFDIGSGATFTATNSASGTNAMVAATAFIGTGTTTEFARFDVAGKNVVAAVNANYSTITGSTSGGSTSSYFRLDGSLTRPANGNWQFKGLRLTGTGAGDALNLSSGTFTFSNSGVLHRGGGDNTYTITNGALTAGSSNLLFNVVQDATLTVQADITQSSGANSVSKGGTGTLVVQGAKTFLGAANLINGVYSIDTIANGGVASGLGASGTAVTNLRFDGGTLRYTGGPASTDRGFTIFGVGATIEANGAGALTWTPAAVTLNNANNNNVGPTTTNAAQNVSLTLGGTSTANNTFNPTALANAAGNGLLQVVKAGSGRWIIGGTNTFSGGVRIDGGTLVASGSGALGSYGAVAFNGGTLEYQPGIATDYSWRIQNSRQAVSVNTNGNNVTFGSVIDESNVGGLQKLGAGTLTVNGYNGYTGQTTVAAGTLAFSTGDSFRNSSSVAIAGGASLAYTGYATTFDRPITVTTGTGTVENSGGSTLTLAGTLTKDGTVLRLTGGAFNVTGQIVGANANSDLVVDAATVTLSNTNSYNGPTFVQNSGTLVVGVSNAIPSNSAVSLAGSTLTVGTRSNTIGSLTTTGNSTLNFSVSGTAGGSLSMTDLAFGGGTNTVAISMTSPTAGIYNLVSYSGSKAGTFTATGVDPNYTLLTGSASNSSIALQRKAEFGTITATPASGSIITGGSTAFGYSVANATPVGGASLLFTSANGPNVAGSSSGAAAAAASSGAVAGLVFTGTSIGLNQAGTFTVTDANAITTTGTGSVSVNVLDHATSSLQSVLLTSSTVSLGTYNFATGQWDSGGPTAGFSIFNLATNSPTNVTADLSLLNVSGTANGFSTNLATYSAVTAGQSRNFLVSFDPSAATAAGLLTTTFQIAMSDDVSLSGATATNTLSVTAEVVVVPEPGVIVLAVSGLVLAGVVRARRRAAV